MEQDIYDFLINCYSADTFFDGVGNAATCKCEQEFWLTEYKNKNLYNIEIMTLISNISVIRTKSM